MSKKLKKEKGMSNLGDKKYCYFVLETQVNEKDEYNALIAVEGTSGFYKTDWYWGKDFKIAKQIADEKNEALGLTKDEAIKIQVSTMFP